MSPVRRYARFVTFAVLLVAGILAVGYVPTTRLGGPAAVPAMAAGCGISLLAAGMAGWPLAAMRNPTPTTRMWTAMLAMVLRLAVVLVLGLAAVLSGLMPRTPLLVWIAASYVALLPLEVQLAVAS